MLTRGFISLLSRRDLPVICKSLGDQVAQPQLLSDVGDTTTRSINPVLNAARLSGFISTSR